MALLRPPRVCQWSRCPPPCPGHDQPGPTSLGPPYAFSWPWTGETGGGDAVAELDPQGQPGTMYVRATWNPGATTASAWMVEGHFFQATGRLAMVSALPSVWYDWYFHCYFQAAHTDGAIGMFVGAYDSQWQWLGPLVDVPVGSLWSHRDRPSITVRTTGRPRATRFLRWSPISSPAFTTPSA
jgi:hypothetical protein